MFDINGRVAHAVSLVRANVLGRWIAAIYALAGLFVFIRDDIWRPAPPERWVIINLIPKWSPEGWTIGGLFVCLFWLFESSFRVTSKVTSQLDSLEQVNRQPISLIFDPNNDDTPRCIEPIKGLYGVEGEKFWVKIKNEGNATKQDVTLRALPSWFTQTVLHAAKLGGSARSRNSPLTIATFPAFHPGTCESVEIFGASYRPDDDESRDITNTVQRFTLEVRARDTPAVTKAFEYDPRRRPMLRVVG